MTITTGDLPTGTFAIGDQLVGNQSGSTKRLTIGSTGLSDYEEGAWTPILIGSSVAGSNTYSTNSGFYTKQGNRVTCDFLMVLTSLSSVGNLYVTGLPFSPANNFSVAQFYTLNLAPFSTAVSIAGVSSSSNRFDLFNTTTTGMSALIDTEITSTFQLRGCLNYRIS